MRQKSKDWIGLIEAGYRLEKSDETWLADILDRASPLLGRGFWPTIGIYNYTPLSSINVESIETQGPALARSFLQSSLQVRTAAVDKFFRGEKAVSSLSEAIYIHEPGIQDVVRGITDNTVKDKFAVKAMTGQNRALIMCWLFAKQITPTERERKRWAQIATHLGAGLRLRKRLSSLTLDSLPIEAIFDASGKLHEARNGASVSSTREVLRNAVKRIDQLRARAGRNNPETSLKLWEGLVDGRWSIVDYFDTDQRRFIVAIKNTPHYSNLCGLTARERQVAEFVGMGRSSKEISYMLGVSHSAITNCTVGIQTKLQLTSRAELTAFFSPGGLRARLAEMDIAGEELLVGKYPLTNASLLENLTEAEQAIVIHILAGSTNADIARRRCTRETTVAKQIQTIFQKLSVRSRSELVARLQAQNLPS